jgi:hypothetical protein
MTVSIRDYLQEIALSFIQRRLAGEDERAQRITKRDPDDIGRQPLRPLLCDLGVDVGGS